MEKRERNLELVDKYLSGSTISALVNEYNLHRSTLQKILLRYNVKLHKNKSLINCDKKFFNSYTKESCYWAGFILADGNLRVNRNSLQIKLGKIDKEHLYNFLKIINCDNFSLIKEYEKYVSLTISLDDFKNDLIENFGVTPRKTYTCKLSDKIPKEMLPHFIRGYFDGDGSITKTTILSINFVGTSILMDNLRSFFKKELKISLKSKNETPPIQKVNGNDKIGMISYSGKNAIKIMEYFYNDITDNIFLSRKLNKYKKLKYEYELR